jgi:hypothetical protein
VTVKDWIATRKPGAPPQLLQETLRLLGADANEPEERTAQVCLGAAARALESLVHEKRFAREDAGELLAIDALTTYAFEYASSIATSRTDLQELANEGLNTFGRLAERD